MIRLRSLLFWTVEVAAGAVLLLALCASIAYGAESSNDAMLPQGIDLAEVDCHLNDRTYTGDEIELFATLTVSGEALLENGVPDYRVDPKIDYYVPGEGYTLTYSNCVDVGKVAVTITGTGENTGFGTYIGSRTETIEILPVHIANAEASGLSSEVFRDGSILAPSLSYRGRALVKDRDYSLSFYHNERPGTAWMKITGKGNYYGEAWYRYGVSIRQSDIGGLDRYATSKMINEEELTFGKYEGIIVASGEEGKFPDALAASGLAGLLNYPVVLINGMGLTAENEAALDSVSQGSGGGLSIIIVGDTPTISSEVEKALAKWGKVEKRLGGVDRFETAQKIYEYGESHGGWNTEFVIVTRGDAFPDALAISPFAAAFKTPVFLVSPGQEELNEKDSTNIENHRSAIILGDEYSVSVEMFDRVRSSLGDGAIRLCGDDRYATASAIVEWELSHGMSMSQVGFARGDAFPDSLAAGLLLSKTNSVLCLVEGSSSSKNENAFLFLDQHYSDVMRVNFFGDYASIPERVRGDVLMHLEGEYVWRSPGEEADKWRSACSICGQVNPPQGHSHVLECCGNCEFLGDGDSLGLHLKESALYYNTGCWNFGNWGSESLNRR